MRELLSPESADTVAKDPRDAEVSQMLQYVLRSLVDRPDDLIIAPLADSAGVSFHVRSAPDEVGKLIGKNGRTARAIRTILSGNAARLGRRYSVDFDGRNQES
jgi:predicted RNA-binding protein YlqC (UPF0109 family)